MRKISVLSLVVTATMFGGCALFSPSYHQPNVEAPTTTRVVWQLNLLTLI